MEKLSIRKISILGLVLMAASAVTAAVVPSKADNKSDKFAAGSLTNHSSLGNGGLISSITCAPDTGTPNPLFACNASTGAGQGNSETTGIDLSGNDDSTSNSSLPADNGNGANNTTSLLGS